MKKKNLLITIASAVAIGAVAIGGTLAYFTASDSAANTFTLGSIDAHLEEVYGYNAEMEMDLAYTTLAESVDDYTMLFPDVFGADQIMSANFDADLLPTETVVKAPYTVLDGNSNDGFVIMSVAIPMSTINGADVAIQVDVNTVIDPADQPLFTMVDVDLANWTCIVPDGTGGYIETTDPSGVEGTENAAGSHMVYVFAYNTALTQAVPETTHLFEAVQFANVIEGSTFASNEDLTILVNTYVIQTEGFTDAIDAFNGTAAVSYLEDLDYNN